MLSSLCYRHFQMFTTLLATFHFQDNSKAFSCCLLKGLTWLVMYTLAKFPEGMVDVLFPDDFNEAKIALKVLVLKDLDVGPKEVRWVWFFSEGMKRTKRIVMSLASQAHWKGHPEAWSCTVCENLARRTGGRQSCGWTDGTERWRLQRWVAEALSGSSGIRRRPSCALLNCEVSSPGWLSPGGCRVGSESTQAWRRELPEGARALKRREEADPWEVECIHLRAMASNPQVITITSCFSQLGTFCTILGPSRALKIQTFSSLKLIIARGLQDHT